MAHRALAKQRHETVEFNEGLHGRLTAVSYTPKASLSFVKWQEVGETLGRMSASMAYWIGDWLVHGEDHFGEKFSQALETTGRDPSTLMNYQRVCRAVKADRRREELSFSHTEVVSSLDEDAQSYWLGLAVDGDKSPSGGPPEMWSSRRLRAEIKKAGQEPADPDPEIIVEDKSLIPVDYMVPDLKAIREAWHVGKREIPGLKLIPPAAVQAEMPA